VSKNEKCKQAETGCSPKAYH